MNITFLSLLQLKLKKQQMKFILLFFISALTLNTCQNEPKEKTSEKILFINSAKVDCTGVGKMKCLQIQESETLTNNWKFFYGRIEGFDYESGYIYKISVKKEELDPATVPADASSIKYSLVEVIEKQKDMKLALDKIWTVKSINEKLVDIPQVADEDNDLVLSIVTDEMKIFGYDGCNNFHGNFELLNDNIITFNSIGSTKMMCSNMDLPSSYITALVNTKTFKLERKNLFFYDINENEILRFVKAE